MSLEIAQNLIDKESILASSQTLTNFYFDKSVIYFLIHKQEIVYIGQTRQLMQRLCAHYLDKTFDSYTYFNVDPDQANHVEAEMIIRFKPDLNRGLPPQDKYWSYDKIKREYGIPKRAAIKLIGRDCITFNGGMYVVMDDEKRSILAEAAI